MKKIDVFKMNRPYIICHMVSSVDGKVTGSFLSSSESAGATQIYYRLNRDICSDGFICGRVTMEGSFTGGWYPDLPQYDASLYDGAEMSDYIPEELSPPYAFAFDTFGRLGWKTNRIVDPDGDPGYDGARIVEVLSEDVDPRYLAYLKEKDIPFVFAGKGRIDVSLALTKIKKYFACSTLLLEGGSVINGAFLREGAVDEISLVVPPVVADSDGKPLFFDAVLSAFRLCSCEIEDGNLILKYQRRV